MLHRIGIMLEGISWSKCESSCTVASPCQAGVKRIAEFAEELAYSLTPPGTQLRLSVQTNGTQLDDEMIDVLRRYRISVGVRLNGTEADNDRSRPYRQGPGKVI